MTDYERITDGRRLVELDADLEPREPLPPFPAIHSLGLFCPLCGHDQWILVPVPALVRYAVCACEGTSPEPQYTAQAPILRGKLQWQIVPGPHAGTTKGV